MRFLLMGPVQIWAGESQVQVRSPRQVLVMAALAADASRVVPVDLLVARVWGDDPPERARRTLHTYITRARRIVEQAGGRVLRRDGGYLLDVDPLAVDVQVFRQLVERARAVDCRDGERVDVLRRARALWRGEPLAGLSGTWVDRTRTSWQRFHLDVTVAWGQTELGAGDPARVLAPISELAERHPLDESLAAIRMRALKAVGRTAEALDTYRTIRHLLATELGADPGVVLRAAHRDVLGGRTSAGPAPVPATATAAHAPAVAVPAAPPLAAAVTASPAPVVHGRQEKPERAGRTERPIAVVPAELPADVLGFAGRDAQLALLDELLEHRASSDPTAMVVAAVSGMAGIGKTALAVRWAHRVRDRFPDGQLYLDLRGYGPGSASMTPEEAFGRLFAAFGVPPHQVPRAVDAQAALYRSLLADSRTLVVLDNARDAEHARPLLPGAPGCAVLVTSRVQLAGLVASDGARPVTLGLLGDEEAVELLDRRLGGGRVAAEPDAVRRIVTGCSNLPLALAVAAARAALHPHFPLSVLADDLGDGRHRLDALDAGDPGTDVRAVLSWSYQALTGEAARLFRYLALHPGPDICLTAVSSLIGRPARTLLAELSRAHLLHEHVPGRFVMHELLREYAREQAQLADRPAELRDAVLRMCGHHLRGALAAGAPTAPTATAAPRQGSHR